MEGATLVMNCNRCNKPIMEGTKFCPECGQEVVLGAKVCSKCNNVLADDAKFCPKCGTSYHPIAIQVDCSKPRNQISKGKRGLTILLVTMIILSAAGFYYYNYIYSNTTNVIYTFAEKINEKDINGVIHCLDPKQERLLNATSSILSTFIEVKLTDVIDVFPFLLDIAGYEGDLQINILKITSNERSGNEAVVKCIVEITSKDDNGNTSVEDGNAEFKLKRFGGEWRIMDIN